MDEADVKRALARLLAEVKSSIDTVGGIVLANDSSLMLLVSAAIDHLAATGILDKDALIAHLKLDVERREEAGFRAATIEKYRTRIALLSGSKPQDRTWH